MYLAYRGVNLIFFLKTSICVAILTFAITLIPIPTTPILSDTLTSCIVGGLITGAGIGLCLRHGGSGGGLDIIGIYFSSRYRNFSVGKIAIFVNAVIYALCAILFSVETAIYSIIYVAVSSLMMDKFHYQNIMVQVTIFTKKEGIAERIDILRRRGFDSTPLLAEFTPKQYEDVLDAMSLAVSAKLGCENCFQTIPQYPLSDSRGLKMQMVFGKE